jgi:hypothetical protein
MENYIGKICPYCKTPLQEGDAVAICSECNMPHHLTCWQENCGCTTFGCTGTIQTVVGAPAPAQAAPVTPVAPAAPTPAAATPAFVFCPHCGTKKAADQRFCPHFDQC